MLVAASRRLLTVLRLTFDLWFGFACFIVEIVATLTHSCASKLRVNFYCKIFQFGKPIYADYFLEALYGMAQASPKFFVREPPHNSSGTGHLT